MISVPSPTIQLVGRYETDLPGISRLLKIYEEASQYIDMDVMLDCSRLEYLDANLVSLLAALDYRLLKERGVVLKTGFDFLKQKFGVLFQNGYLKDENYTAIDALGRPLQLIKIDPNDEAQFIDFLDSQLMCHKAISSIDEKMKKIINSQIIEIYSNIQRHSKSSYPFFGCGHHFLSAGIFKITFVDLGVGFLPAIELFTKGRITRDGEAIQWAMEDFNSTTDEPLSGAGLKYILKFCSENGGKLEVVSGKDFWSSDLLNKGELAYVPMETGFKGTLINIWLKCA